MELENTYDLQARSLAADQNLRHFFDHVVKEIRSCAGEETEIQVRIEPEDSEAESYAVAVAVYGLRKPVIVERDGRSVMAALRKVKKSVLREIHRLNEKRSDGRRKFHFREQFAS